MMQRTAILVCLLLLAGSAYAQAPRSFVEIDSVLFVRPDTTPPYPFQAQYDSLQDRRRQIQQNAEGIVDFFLPNPEPVVQTDTGRVAYEDFLSATQPMLPDSLFCLIQLKVAWTGAVERAELTACKGAPPPSIVDLRSVFQQVAFEEMSMGNEFPMPGMFTSLPIYGKAAK